MSSKYSLPLVILRRREQTTPNYSIIRAPVHVARKHRNTRRIKFYDVVSSHSSYIRTHAYRAHHYHTRGLDMGVARCEMASVSSNLRETVQGRSHVSKIRGVLPTFFPLFPPTLSPSIALYFLSLFPSFPPLPPLTSLSPGPHPLKPSRESGERCQLPSGSGQNPPLRQTVSVRTQLIADPDPPDSRTELSVSVNGHSDLSLIHI